MTLQRDVNVLLLRFKNQPFLGNEANQYQNINVNNKKNKLKVQKLPGHTTVLGS